MLGIHGSLPELFRIHLTQTFVSLDLVVAVTSDFRQDPVQFFVAVRVPYFSVLFQLIKRRLRQIYIPFLDQVRHEPVEEGEQESTDMCSVNIGIGHDDDLVISEFCDVKIIMDPGSEGCDHGLDLCVGIDLVQTCLLHIEDLSSQRKDSLGRTVPCRLCGTAGGISLNDVDLAVCRIFVRTVGKFSGKGHSFQSGFSSCQIPRLSRCLSCPLRSDGLFDRSLRHVRVLFKENLKLAAHDTVHRASCLAVSEFLFCLSFKLRVLDLYTYDRCKPLPDIFSCQLRIAVLQKLILFRIVVERLGKSGTESLYMCPALRRCNIIYKTVCVVAVGIIVLHGNFDIYAVFYSLAVDDLVIERSLALIQICHKFLDSAFIVEDVLMQFLFPPVSQDDPEPLGKESHLTESLFEYGIVKYRILKDFFIGKECDFCPGPVRFTFSDHFQFVTDLASLIALFVDLSLVIDLNLKPFREGVHDRGSHTVESSGYFVSPAAEFSSGMEDRKYDFYGRKPGLVVDPHRDSPPVVADCHGIVLVDVHLDLVTVSCESLIH